MSKSFSHRLINNIWQVRVTGMLDKVIDKGEGFKKWLQYNGVKADEIAQAAGNKGTLVHKACEHLLTNGIIRPGAYEGMDDSALKMIMGFKNFVKDAQVRPFKSEFEVCDGQCSGQADLLLINQPNGKSLSSYILADIKTGSSIYITHYLQLMFYLKCVKVMYPESEIIPYIIHLKDSTKKGYQVVEFTEDEIKRYSEGYELAYKLYVILGHPLEPKPEYTLPKEIKLEE